MIEQKAPRAEPAELRNDDHEVSPLFDAVCAAVMADAKADDGSDLVDFLIELRADREGHAA